MWDLKCPSHNPGRAVVAAGSIIAAIPTAFVFFIFQKQFVSGLLVGTNK